MDRHPFPEPSLFNGADMRHHGSTNGEPESWKCLTCVESGKGYISRARHWYAHEPRHKMVAGFDPRAKTAPRVSGDPDPSTQTMPSDGEGRR